ncbi:MAG: leucine-rich repeat domain-containing protein [Rikenellaceae bacterium]
MRKLLLLLFVITNIALYAAKPAKEKKSKSKGATELTAELLASAVPIESITTDNYPDKNIWIVSGATNDLSGVRDALISAAAEDKTIELSLLNISDIPDEAFLECSALAHLNAPEATSIGRDAFANCGALGSVNMPVLTSIGESAFKSCSTLSDLHLPTLSSIKGSAFLLCDALTSLTLGTDGAGIGDIAADAFDGFNTESCTLIIKSGVVEIEENVLTLQSSIDITFLSISDMN